MKEKKILQEDNKNIKCILKTLKEKKRKCKKYQYLLKDSQNWKKNMNNFNNKIWKIKII